MSGKDKQKMAREVTEIGESRSRQKSHRRPQEMCSYLQWNRDPCVGTRTPGLGTNMLLNNSLGIFKEAETLARSIVSPFL